MPSMLIHFSHILSAGTDESCDICRQSAVSFIRTDDKQLFEEDIAKMATVHFAAGHRDDAEHLNPAPLEEVEIMWVDDNVPRFWTTKTLRLNAEQHRRQFDHFYWTRDSAVYCMFRTPSMKPRAPPVLLSPSPVQEVVLPQTGHPALRFAAGPSSSAFSGQPGQTAPQPGTNFLICPPPANPVFKRDINQQPQHRDVTDRAQDGPGSKKAAEPKPAHSANQNGSASLFHPQQPSQPWPQSQPSVSASTKPQQTTGFTTQTSKLQEAEFQMPCRRRSLQQTAGDQTLAAAFRVGQTLPHQHPLASQHKAQQGPVTTTATKGPPNKTRPEVGDRNVKKLPRSGMRKSVPTNNTFALDGAHFAVSPAGSPQKVVQQQHAESRHPLAAEPLYADSDEPMRDASGCYDVFDGRSGWGN
ncbi:2-dehydropantoate 2-reductase (Ketopantoate reductase) (KPA reductase) (KPR) [Pestalotiopsis sp. IQ-011]